MVGRCNRGFSDKIMCIGSNISNYLRPLAAQFLLWKVFFDALSLTSLHT